MLIRCLSILFFAVAASAQTGSFSFNSLNLSLSVANNTYTNYLTGATGTAVFPGIGNATVTVPAFSSTRERGLTCGNYVQMTLNFSFNATDSVSVLLSSPTVSLATTAFNITGGTGAFAGKGGSGTVALTVSVPSGPGPVVLTGSGSGTFTSTPAAVAAISPEGIVPLYSAVPIIQPGSWISIYGSNLSNTTATWNGDFPKTLGGVSVMIDNKPGYLWYVSPGLINVEAPDDNIQGCVNVSLTTPNGTVTSQITLQPQQPSFSLLSAKYVVAEILTPDGSGAFGTYDLAGPTGAFSFKTRPAKVGETIVLYGVGFGSTMTKVAAGQFPAAPTPTVFTPNITIGGVPATVQYSGLIGPGLYQMNVVVPKVPSGDQLIVASIPAPNPLLFSSNSTQNCKDDDPQGAVPTNCAIYITIQ